MMIASSSLTMIITVLLCCFSALTEASQQIRYLQQLLNSPRIDRQPWELASVAKTESFRDRASVTQARREADKVHSLPGQPRVEFRQYAGYVTVDSEAGSKELFYYLAESPSNHSAKPLLLWLNGGPGCSSLGYGAMEELGPFRVNSDGRTLRQNKHAWNKVANVLFLESPAGVGFSYSHTGSRKSGDHSTARDSLIFLLNWLERFPEYKNRDLYIVGESYAGHYVPQLAYKIISRNKHKKGAAINLKGIATGNAWMHDALFTKGAYEFMFRRDLISESTHGSIMRLCNFKTGNYSDTCTMFMSQAYDEMGVLNIDNIYAPSCNPSAPKSQPEYEFDPCTDYYVEKYLNLPEVQEALHARSTNWSACNSNVISGWTDSPRTVLPIIQKLISSGIRLWVYSGDVDALVPITCAKLAINSLNLPLVMPWWTWYSGSEVGGYMIGYKGLVLTTVRGAGHEVPSYQPEKALTMIAAFLEGRLPPGTLI